MSRVSAITVPVLAGSSSSTQADLSDIESLPTIFSKFASVCRNPACKRSVAVTDFEHHIENWLIGAQKIPPSSQISGLSCPDCFTSTCAGCGQEPRLGQESTFTSFGVVNSCCPNGRLYSIWLLLSHFDKREVAVRKTHLPNKSPPKPKKPIHGGSAHPDGFASGTGYAGGWDPLFSSANNSILSTTFVDVEEENPDQLAILVMKVVTALLPDASIVDGKLLLDELLCLLPNSLLFDYLADLVRNDSITDLIARRDVYASAIALIENLSEHRLLQHLLFLKRVNKRTSPGLYLLCTNRDQIHVLKAQVPKDKLPSIYDNGVHLLRQAQTLLRMSEKSPKGSIDHSKECIRMCKIVVTAFEKLQRIHAIYGDTKPTQDEVANDESAQIWLKYCSQNAVTFSDNVLKNHRYEDKFVNLKSANKGRLTAISREIANMTTSLPTGIFVKVAESRSDVMKILIVGIEGTPYEGGLFTFDLYLDSNYPNTPPKMTFTSDGNDSEDWSFNPNLHKGTGTVCLSILNTWQGHTTEMWQPGKSTILAVLISIQAMILGVPLPWINEPGFAQQDKTPEAQEHKLLIQYKTVRYAMLRWIGVLDYTKEVWDDIRQMYWKHNSLSTFLTVKEWAKDNHMISKIPGCKQKPNKKSKRQVATPDIPDGDLLEKLATLLNLTEHLDSRPPKIEEPESSRISQKKSNVATKNKSAQGKRKHDELSNNSETDDSVNDEDDLLDLSDHVLTKPFKSTIKAPAKKKKPTSPAPKPKSTITKSIGKGKGKEKILAMVKDIGATKWVYTGGKTQKETRQACLDFEISGAKSIKDTITKLEAYVNESGLGDNDIAQRWGTLEASEQ